MGKPFKKELEKIFDTYSWAAKQQKIELFDFLKESGRPTLIIGSGGSLSACHYFASLLVNCGIFAKAITPLEVYYSRTILNNSNLVFLSASGKNTDILFGFKLALKFEPNCIISICMKEGSPLAKLSLSYSNTKTFEYNLPSGKDGFLATNSLIAFYSILYNNFNTEVENFELRQEDSYLSDISTFLNKVPEECTFHLLHGGWGHSVAVDIESKFTEAGLGNILLSDYRNFGHGRHHWFDKKKKSAIIALVTPEEELISKRTLSLLPSSIPQLVLKSNSTSPISSIDLLIKSFYLVDKMGELQGIDPGKPGVPEYGSKLYHLKYSSFYTLKNQKIPQDIINAVLRKLKVKNLSELSIEELNHWLNAYSNFISKLTSAKFGSLVFDFDGTLCSLENRFIGISEEVIQSLVRFLSKGFIIGVVTGRGKSARTELQNVIPKEYWDSIIMGYYNGADIGTLNNDKLPNKQLPIENAIQKIYELISNYKLPYKLNLELRPNQLTIEINNTHEWDWKKR